MKSKVGSRENTYDVIVLGGGIAGLCCALALSERGEKVLVAGRINPLGEATAASAGILDPLLEMDAPKLLSKVCLRAFKEFPRFIKKLQRKTKFKTDYQVTGMLYAGITRGEISWMKKRFYAHRKLKFPVKWFEARKLRQLCVPVDGRAIAGLYYPTIARVNPRKLKDALRKRLKQLGVDFIKSKNDPRVLVSRRKVTGITAGKRAFHARTVITATGCWSGLGTLKVPVEPIRGQIALYRGNQRLETILHSTAGAYLVPWSRGVVLAGSTVESCGYDSAVTRRGMKTIHRSVEQLFPGIKKFKKIQSWAGLRPKSVDRKPIVGRSKNTEGLFYATGYYRSGILIGFYMGELLARVILTGKIPSELKPFLPGRFSAA